MHPSFLLPLLQTICKAPVILTFRNFPDVILAGNNTYNGPTKILDGGAITANVANALPTANGRSAVSIDASGTGSSNLTLGASQFIVSLTGVSSTSTVNLNANTLTIPSYTTVDALLRYEVSRNVNLALSVSNLTNKDYALSAPNGGAQWVLGAPRTVMLTARAKF